jgi:hypothetical protein
MRDAFVTLGHTADSFLKLYMDMLTIQQETEPVSRCGLLMYRVENLTSMTLTQAIASLQVLYHAKYTYDPSCMRTLSKKCRCILPNKLARTLPRSPFKHRSARPLLQETLRHSLARCHTALALICTNHTVGTCF